MITPRKRFYSNKEMKTMIATAFEADFMDYLQDAPKQVRKVIRSWRYEESQKEQSSTENT